MSASGNSSPSSPSSSSSFHTPPPSPPSAPVPGLASQSPIGDQVAPDKPSAPLPPPPPPPPVPASATAVPVKRGRGRPRKGNPSTLSVVDLTEEASAVVNPAALQNSPTKQKKRAVGRKTTPKPVVVSAKPKPKPKPTTTTSSSSAPPLRRSTRSRQPPKKLEDQQTINNKKMAPIVKKESSSPQGITRSNASSSSALSPAPSSHASDEVDFANLNGNSINGVNGINGIKHDEKSVELVGTDIVSASEGEGEEEEKIFYLAVGKDMSKSWMRRRVMNDARLVDIGRLDGYEYIIDREVEEPCVSQVQAQVPSTPTSPSKHVYGLIYEINSTALARLQMLFSNPDTGAEMQLKRVSVQSLRCDPRLGWGVKRDLWVQKEVQDVLVFEGVKGNIGLGEGWNREVNVGVVEGCIMGIPDVWVEENVRRWVEWPRERLDF